MLLTDVITIRLDLASFHQAYSEPDNSQLIIDQKLAFIVNDLRNLIGDFNQRASSDSRPIVKIDCPALHLLTEFALFECIKNSIDAKANTLTLSIYLGNNRVFVNLNDDAARGATQKDYGSYSYEKALRQGSEKSRSDGKCLGGGGRGLAMSAQYLTKFAKSGALLSGHRAKTSTGFTVTLSSENESATTAWHDYLHEFDPFYQEVRSTSSTGVAGGGAAANNNDRLDDDFLKAEQQFITRVQDYTNIRQQQHNNNTSAFFSFDGADDNTDTNDGNSFRLEPLHIETQFSSP